MVAGGRGACSTRRLGAPELRAVNVFVKDQGHLSILLAPAALRRYGRLTRGLFQDRNRSRWAESAPRRWIGRASAATGVTRALAAHASSLSYDALPAPLVERIKQCVLDTRQRRLHRLRARRHPVARL